MKHPIRGLALALLFLPLSVLAAQVPSQRHGLPIDPAARGVETPALNAAKALAEDALADKGRPLRYAIMHKSKVDLDDDSKSAVGRWTEVGDEQLLWRTRIDAPGAVSIDLALKPFHLPEGAEVWLVDAAGTMARGPYTANENPKSGEFWTPYVPGDVAYLEVLVPKSRRDELRLGVHSIQQAYRHIESGASPFEKSGSCNVDVACPEGNGYRDQINAVARYSVSGGLCTGQLMNNTAQDNKRLFLTANHCFSTQSDANSVVAYWKYESPTCRTPGSSASGGSVCTPFDNSCVASNSIVQTGGAILRATHEPADTTLVELNTAVPSAANPFWLGWDRGTDVPASGVGIHHPQGDEKRISFENQPLVNSDVGPAGVPGDKHWKVTDWDLGTTEQGSSGSVLLNPQKRLVGVLSGGGAACGNNQPDYYGRLNIAWEGDGSAASRVKDWLDPGNSGTTAIDGKASCAAPSVDLSLTTADPGVDQTVTVSVAVSGGTGPYTLSWDVDGDGVEDRRSSGVAASQQHSLRFPDKRDVSIVVAATDAVGCSAQDNLQFALRGPRLSAQAEGTPVQSCGDGDANIEPGEIWNIPVRVDNSGDDALDDGFAIFTGGTAVGAGGGGGGDGGRSDAFGYVGLSSKTSSSCRYQAIDMSSATSYAPTRSPDVQPTTSALDEGYVANLPVGGAQPFRFYDANISQLMISTNGYLSTVNDGGDDYDGACGYDDNGVIDGRLQVLHADLVLQTSGSLKHRQFSPCPRPSDVGASTQGCTVFEWNNLGHYTSASTPPDGNAVFQAVLYHESYEIVYQYVTADPDQGESATIGLQNSTETVRFDFSCGVAQAATAGSADCFFHPTALPSSAAEATLHVVSSAANLGNLAAGANLLVNATAYVDPGATCGTRAVVSYLGAVDDFAYSFAPNKVLDVAMPATGNCQVATQCAAQLASLGAPTSVGGMYFNPNRSGNGQNIFNIGNVFSSAWFTGEADRSPIWYLMAGPWNPTYSQAKADVRKFTRTSSAPFTVSSTAVGKAQFTRGDDDAAYINTWELGGVWGGEKLVRFYSGSDLPTPNHSGGWYNPAESGWGLVVDEHRIAGQASTGIVSYLYDAANEPRWTLGEQFNTSNTVAHNLFYVHCPSCPRFSDFGTQAVAVGTMTRSYQSQTAGTIDTALTLPATFGGSWNRTALPIQMLTPPLSPSP